MELKTIIRVIKRWILLLILGMVIAGSTGYYLSSQQTPMYRTSTRFVVLRAASTGYDYYAYIDYQQLISTYTQLLSTDALLAQVSEEVGFPVYGGANAEQVGETQFVRLTVTNQDPLKAATIANALVNVLIDQNEQLQSVRYETTQRNMQQRADQAMQQMEILQNQINEISVLNLEEQITQVQTQIDDLQTQATELEFKISEIDPEIATEAQRLERLQYQAELNQIQPILNLYQQIYTELIVMGEPMQRDNASSIQMAQLQRTLNLYEQIYFNSISSLEALNLTRVQSAPNVVQVEPATVPGSPYSPQPMQTATLYGAVGLLAMAGIAFLIEYLDDTLKTPDDVKDTLGLPVLGFVADIKGSNNNDNKSGVFVANQPRSPVSEAFRAIRTSLEFYSVDRPLHTLLVTSSGPGEGKTTIATNLAIILSQNNKRVLLLDTDMRRPNVHYQLNISNRIGLSDLMRDRLMISDVIQTSKKVPNLSVITSGSLPPNPAELLSSERMSRIIDQLREKFDMIVMDTPPAIVTDAQILSTKADGVLYVIRPGKTRAIAARTPLEEFARVGANVIGVIMNRIPRNRDFYYGGYDYYSPKDVANKYYRHKEKTLLDQPIPEKE